MVDLYLDRAADAAPWASLPRPMNLANYTTHIAIMRANEPLPLEHRELRGPSNRERAERVRYLGARWAQHTSQQNVPNALGVRVRVYQGLVGDFITRPFWEMMQTRTSVGDGKYVLLSVLPESAR